MKKKISAIVVIFSLVLAVLTPCFLRDLASLNPNNIAFGSGIEADYSNETTRDLISANITTILTNGVVESGITPYNLETKARYEGSVITPSNVGEYGEFYNKSFGITGGYSPKEDDAIFLWVYLLETYSFTLKISISNGTDVLTWSFSHQEVMEMGEGWKLLQLNLLDHKNRVEDYDTKTYTSIIFSYYSEAEDDEVEEDDVYSGLETETSERFSFYHVFATENVSNTNSSGVVYKLPKAYYEYSDDFNFTGSVFIGDKILLKSAKDIFEVLFIGKYDLSNYATESKYYWTVSLTSPSLTTSKIEFGNYLKFYEEGYYYLTIQLHDQNKSVIMNDDISIFCEELALGRFLMGLNYTMKDNEKITISFIVANGVDFDDYTVSIDNNNAIIYSNYQENGRIYICVEGVSSGTSTLEISAKATSKNGTKSKALKSSATITISKSKTETSTEVLILWIVLACFSTGFIIYMSISVVKSRKNDVK